MFSFSDRVGITTNARVLVDIGVLIVVGIFGAVGILLMFYVIKWQHQSNMCLEFEKRPRNIPTHKLIKKKIIWENTLAKH